MIPEEKVPEILKPYLFKQHSVNPQDNHFFSVLNLSKIGSRLGRSEITQKQSEEIVEKFLEYYSEVCIDEYNLLYFSSKRQRKIWFKEFREEIFKTIEMYEAMSLNSITKSKKILENAHKSQKELTFHPDMSSNELEQLSIQAKEREEKERQKKKKLKKEQNPNRLKGLKKSK